MHYYVIEYTYTYMSAEYIYKTKVERGGYSNGMLLLSPSEERKRKSIPTRIFPLLSKNTDE